MKCIFLFLPILLISAVLGSCTKSSMKTTSAHFVSSTTIGGGSYYGADTTLQIQGNPGGSLYVASGLGTGNEFRIWFASYPTAPGTVYVSTLGTYILRVFGGSMFTSAHGSITVTSVSPSIVGTFAYTNTDSSTVTGSFSVPAAPY